MISRQDLNDYGNRNRTLNNMASNELSGYMRALNYEDPESAQTALLRVTLAIMQTYGAALAQNSTQFFETTNSLTAVSTTEVVEKTLFSEAQLAALKSAVAFAVSLAAAGAVAYATKALVQKVRTRLKVIPFVVMERNAERHGLKYARVPRGETTCEFCTMLASRGFVYNSRESASGHSIGREGFPIDAVHDDCDCEIVCEKDEEIEDYDPGFYYEEYSEARDIVEPGAWERWQALSEEEQDYFGSFNEFLEKSILAQMRSMRSGTYFKDHEPAVPKTQFASNIIPEEVRDKIKSE